jgi:hypothetical protein
VKLSIRRNNDIALPPSTIRKSRRHLVHTKKPEIYQTPKLQIPTEKAETTASFLTNSSWIHKKRKIHYQIKTDKK